LVLIIREKLSILLVSYYKFRKELKKTSELKANKSSPELREHILKKASGVEDLRCHSMILDKTKITSDFLKYDHNKLYNYVCGYLANSMNIGSKNLNIRIDKSKGKQGLQLDFNNYVKNKLLEKRWNRKIKINHSWSHAWHGLQIADFVSWAVFQKFEHGNDYYFRIIEDKTNINHIWDEK
tara:strand:+ start:920 stop:1462 length:543 start_codon:yes stop_codon:yes gene_type:complete